MSYILYIDTSQRINYPYKIMAFMKNLIFENVIRQYCYLNLGVAIETWTRNSCIDQISTC